MAGILLDNEKATPEQRAEKDVLIVMSNCPRFYNPCSGLEPDADTCDRVEALTLTACQSSATPINFA